ncbi:hypothetical protein BDV18DRAFT_128984 [Aspergillus unguis]
MWSFPSTSSTPRRTTWNWLYLEESKTATFPEESSSDSNKTEKLSHESKLFEEHMQMFRAKSDLLVMALASLAQLSVAVSFA